MAGSNLPVIKPLHRRLVEYYLLFKCQIAPTARTIGIARQQDVRDILDRPEVKAYLEQRMDDLSAVVTAKTTDVIATLNRQMLADVADLLPDEPILQKARANGVSRNIKKIKITEDIDKHGNTHRKIELEMYSSQEAAKSLARIFGLDSQDELQHARTAIKLYCEIKNCDPDVAIIALAPHVPGVVKVKDEFLVRKANGGEGVVIDGAVTLIPGDVEGITSEGSDDAGELGEAGDQGEPGKLGDDDGAG